MLPPPCPLSVQPVDFSHAGELIERALSDSRAYLNWLEHRGAPEGSLAPAERLVAHAHS